MEGKMSDEKKEARFVKAAKKRTGLFFHIFHLIEDYSPESDAEILRLLAICKERSSNGIDSQWFVERLTEFWDMKINFHIDAIWNQIRNRELTSKEKGDFLSAAKNVEKLINFAVGQMRSLDCYENAESFLSSRSLRSYLHSVVSFLEDSLGQDEARIFDERDLSISDAKIIRISTVKQLGAEVIIIPKLPELAEDDHMGHALRNAGWLNSWPLGRVIVDGWNLPLIENEGGELLVPIEKMLSEMGGCPIGFVYDSKNRRHGEGYNMHEKSCRHCWKKEYCPGNRCLEARSFSEIVEKLHLAWICRDDIQKVIPEFRNKTLAR